MKDTNVVMNLSITKLPKDIANNYGNVNGNIIGNANNNSTIMSVSTSEVSDIEKLLSLAGLVSSDDNTTCNTCGMSWFMAPADAKIVLKEISHEGIHEPPPG